MTDDPHVRLDPAVRIERAVELAVRAGGHGDRAFDRLDDVGEGDGFSGSRQREAAARTAYTGEEAAVGELAHKLLGRRKRQSGLVRKLGRAEARSRGTAGGGG